MMKQIMIPYGNQKASFKRPEANSILVNNNNENNSNRKNGGMDYLTVPKLTKQFLISPPASPPTDWQPINEGAPVIDVQLISAIANLVPGEIHEIHSGNENQPRIFVEVCEDPVFDPSPGIIIDACDDDDLSQTSQRIPKTPRPANLHGRSLDNSESNILINSSLSPDND